LLDEQRAEAQPPGSGVLSGVPALVVEDVAQLAGGDDTVPDQDVAEPP
jgi:hypothetical protein